MMWQRYRAPLGALPLDEPVNLTETQQERAAGLIEQLSRSTESFPVVLSQDGEVICYAGLADEMLARRFARLADRLWRVGGPAREVIRFEEELVGEGDEQHSYLIYTAHVAGALTLTIGWQLSVSLTQLRAEAADTIEELRSLLA